MHALHKLLLFQVLTSLGQNADGSKIIGGELAPDNTMKYMVSLQKNETHVCGGFLVSDIFVVTAAHCGANEPDRVVFGTHNLRSVGDENVRTIVGRYKHESYNQIGNGHDILILKLSSKVAVNTGASIVSLPTSNTYIEDNKTCQVAGWGFTVTGGNNVDRLRVVDVSVINRNKCSKLWDGLPENVICAGGFRSTKGFCQGDSGGPLVCSGTAVGIVSFNKHRNCTYPADVPNVYTDISKYIDWINGIINREDV